MVDTKEMAEIVSRVGKMLIAATSKGKRGDGYQHRTFSDEYPWQKPPRAAAPITDEERENWRLLGEIKP